MDAAVEMSGMLEANNYNSVTYSVLGNIYLDALASHHYILSICEVLDSDLYCHDLITFSKILIDISKYFRARKVTNHGICAEEKPFLTHIWLHAILFIIETFMLKVGIFQQ